MKLNKFIVKNGGDTAVAKKLGVSVETVRKWRIGETSPRPRSALALIKMSRGTLSWKDVYIDSTTK